MSGDVAGAYEIELSEPSVFTCECCGGLTVRLTRFVHKQGDAFAVYYAAYSNNHAENEVAMLISLGEWGEGSKATQRVAFYCLVRPSDDSYEVMLGDAAESAWGDAELVGKKLSRMAALRHRWKDAAFEVLDAAFEQDSSLTGFLHRVQCGDAAVPLEKNFHMPDEVFALGGERGKRAQLTRSFASLDEKKFYVRCLLPVPVEGYGEWSIGLWVQVERTDYEHLVEVWNDPAEYSKVRFSGVLSNDVAAEIDLPIAIGTELQLHAPDPDRPPTVMASADAKTSDLLSKSWPKADFEAYAVAHGFL